jgi:hypothetical protein
MLVSAMLAIKIKQPRTSMPASRRTKWVLWTIVCAIALTIGCVGHAFYTAWHRFTSEEKICGTFHPVINALDEFQQQTGSPPTNLTQLVPHYLLRIPSEPFVDSIEYRRLPDGANWQLSVRSSVRGTPELFVQRSSQNFSAEEQRQRVTGFHAWIVFKQP